MPLLLDPYTMISACHAALFKHKIITNNMIPRIQCDYFHWYTLHHVLVFVTLAHVMFIVIAITLVYKWCSCINWYSSSWSNNALPTQIAPQMIFYAETSIHTSLCSLFFQHISYSLHIFTAVCQSLYLWNYSKKLWNRNSSSFCPALCIRHHEKFTILGYWYPLHSGMRTYIRVLRHYTNLK